MSCDHTVRKMVEFRSGTARYPSHEECAYCGAVTFDDRYAEVMAVHGSGQGFHLELDRRGWPSPWEVNRK